MNDPGIIERLTPLMSESRLQRIREVLDNRISSIVTVLDNLHDAHNLSAIIRSSEGLGVSEIHAIEASEKIKLRKRITQGCHKWIDLHKHKNSEGCLQALKERGFLLCGAEPLPGAISLEELPVDRRLALVFGAEHVGLRAETKALLDCSFQIPMNGFTRALNASVAAAVSLYTTTTRWRAHHQKKGDLSEEEKTQLQARFCRDSVRGARLIIALGADEEAIKQQKKRRIEWMKGG